MFSLSLTEKEMELVRISINHCLETCKNKSSKADCADCRILESVLEKLP